MGYQVGSLWWERFSELGIEKEEELRTLKRGRIYTRSRRVLRVTTVTAWETRRKCSRKLQSTCWEELQSPLSCVWGVWAFGSPVRGQGKARLNTLTLTESWFLLFIYYYFLCANQYFYYTIYLIFSLLFSFSPKFFFFFYWNIVDLENAVSITAAQQSDSFYILFRYDISWDIESSPLCLLFILTEDTDLTSLVSMIATLCACVCVRWEVEEDIKWKAFFTVIGYFQINSFPLGEVLN